MRSGPASEKPMSMSPFSSISRWFCDSGMWRMMMRFIALGSPQNSSLRVRITRSLAFQPSKPNMPEPAELVLSQSAPRSPSFSFSMTSLLSSTDPGPTMPSVCTITCGSTGFGSVTTTVFASGAVKLAAAFSALKPWVFRNEACARFSVISRFSDQTTSSAVTGLPEAKVAPSRRWKVMLLLSGAISQLSARSGFTLARSLASRETRPS